MEILLVSIILFIAGVIKGMMSFGFGIIAVTLLSLFISPLIAIPLVTINAFLNNIVIIKKKRNAIQRNKLKYTILAGIIGVPLGVSILTYINKDLLRVLLGGIVIVAGIALYSGIKINPGKNKQLIMSGAGFLGGILGGAVSVVGPPMAVFFHAIGLTKESFRGNLIGYQFIISSAIIIMYGVNGLITHSLIPYILRGVPGMIAGTYLGIIIGNKIAQEKFKVIVIITIILLGLLNILKGSSLI